MWEARRPAITQENPLANPQFSRFTDWEGTEGAAEISPDGRFVAFLADRAGQFDIWLSQVGTGRFSNLTSDIAPLDGPRSDALVRTFGFSGDGAEIWFSAAGDAGSAKMLIPLTGGPPRAFLNKGDVAPSWSPDGTRLAYFNNGHGDPLFVADRTGADPGQIVLQPKEVHEAFFKKGMHNHNPVWSPDGEWIYFVHGVDPTIEMDVWRVRPSGGSPERITQQHVPVNFRSAAQRPHAPACGAREGLVRTVAVDARCRAQGTATRHLRHRALHLCVGQSRRPAGGRHSGQPKRQPVASATAQSTRRGPRRPAVPAADDEGDGPALWRAGAVLRVRGRAGRRTVAASRRSGVRSLERRGRRVSRATCSIRRRTPRGCRH